MRARGEAGPEAKAPAGLGSCEPRPFRRLPRCASFLRKKVLDKRAWTG